MANNIEMNDFLLRYYMQLHFNSIPPENFATFSKYLKNNDFSGNMKEWATNLMTPNENGQLEQRELPDPVSELSDAEWDKLFNAFQNAFRGMYVNKKSFEDNPKATAFLNEYFGNPDTHLFSNGHANEMAEQQIETLKELLSDNSLRPTISFYIKDILKDSGLSYAAVLTNLNKKQYNTDLNFQSVLKQIASYMSYYIHNDETLAKSKYKDSDFSAIESGFEDTSVNTDKLEFFKRNYKTLLNTLHNEPKVYEVFKQFDNGKISKPLDKALSKVDYSNTESKDYLPPQREDELTPLQRIKGEISDTLEDYMGKYIKLRGDRLYFSDSAKNIVKAIDGTKFKPTDGIGKILENAKNIQDNLRYKSPRATEHFNWLTSTLTDLKNTMPKAFNGALKNGRQMKALIEELIIKAVRENKIDEAKTTMEVLSVIKYGYTTSKIMDALKQQDLTIFSDGSLSWNKHEGVQFVTKAFDKSIRAAFLGLGYAFTATGNAINLSGRKFNGKNNRIQKHQQIWQKNNQNGLQEAIKKRDTENALDIKTKQRQKQIIKETKITEQNFQTETDKLEKSKKELEQKNAYIANATESYNATSKTLKTYDENKNQESTLNDEIQQLQQKLTDINNTLNNNDDNQDIPQWQKDAQADTMTWEMAELEEELEQKKQELLSLQENMENIPPEQLQQMRDQVQAYENMVQQAQQQEQEIYQLDSRINNYTKATESIKELDAQIKKREEEVSKWDDKHKDMYKELMAYWDFLETGRSTHMGNMYSWTPGSAKKKQNKFDANKLARLQAYMQKHDRS